MVWFVALGIEEDIQRAHGNLAVSIADFESNVSSLPIWSELSTSELWNTPHPECILHVTQSNAQHHSSQVPGVYSVRDIAPDTAQMADGMVPRGHGAFNLELQTFKWMSRMMRLGMRDRSWLTLWESNMQRIKEQDTIMTKKAPMQTMRDCSHPEWKRHGNIHGSFATCLLCHMKAKWNTEQGAWQSIGLAGSRRSSLPLPSSSSILSPSRATHSRSICLDHIAKSLAEEHKL